MMLSCNDDIIARRSQSTYKEKFTLNYGKKYLNSVLISVCIGFQGFTYPPHVGLSIGTAADPLFVLMEVHYDNPSETEGL